MIQKLPDTKRAQRIGSLTASLGKLDIDLDSHKSQRNSATIVFIVGLLLTPIILGIPVVLFALVNYFRHKNAVQRLQQRRVGMASELAVLQAGGR